MDNFIFYNSLEDTQVFRGGITAPNYTIEDTDVSGKIDAKGVSFIFYLASKGGGITQVCLTVGAKAMQEIVTGLAQYHPSLAESFAEATYIAVKKFRPKRRLKSSPP